MIPQQRVRGCRRRAVRHWLPAFLVSLALATTAGAAPASVPPGTQVDVLPARIGARFDPRTHCPDLRPADPEEPGVAVVVFQVGTTGVPSHPEVRPSSGTPALDDAAASCVMKLRFRPATRRGDGEAIESWQQAAWKWAPAARAMAPVAVAGAGAAVVAGAGAASHASGRSVEVRVCVDADGKLDRDPTVTRSSGDPAFDAAALGVAKSGSGQFRPVPGCERLSISLE